MPQFVNQKLQLEMMDYVTVVIYVEIIVLKDIQCIHQFMINVYININFTHMHVEMK